MDGSDWIGESWAALRPEQRPDGGFRGGAMAGDVYLALQSIISRKKNTSG
jgi:hypothetical protein